MLATSLATPLLWLQSQSHWYVEEANIKEEPVTDRVQLGWLIAFVASIIADIQNPYPKYAWWTLAYMLCCIIGITVVFACDSANHYSLAVSRPPDMPREFSLT